MTNRHTLVTLSTLALLAACGSEAPVVDADLARDLQAVGTSSALELAPTAGSMQVMSAIEQQGSAAAAVAAPAPTRAPAPRVAVAPRRKPVVRAARATPRATEPAPAPTPEPIGESEELEQVAAPRPAAPSSAPLGAGPAPAGGWKSVDEVIRNSRIPIKP